MTDSVTLGASTRWLFPMLLVAASAAGACSTGSPPGYSRDESAPPDESPPRIPPTSIAEHPPERSAAKSPEPAPRNGSADPFASVVKKVALEYKAWQRVDERPGSAPAMCAYWPPHPSTARQSEPDAKTAHGKKLFFLHASDLREYQKLASPQDSLPVGFSIVKESYRAVELDDRTSKLLEKHRDLRLDLEGKFFRMTQWPLAITEADAARYGLRKAELSIAPLIEIPPAARRGDAKGVGLGFDSMDPRWAPPIRTTQIGTRWFRTGEQADLFVMTKVAKTDKPGTDHGWVYGVVSADGSSVRQSGKLDHCVGCHEKAPHDRLFATVKGTGEW